MKILLTGANGQLGYEIIRQNSSFDLIALNRSELDITDLNQVESRFAEIHPELVINAAAYTAVDKAEIEPELAFSVNREGPANLAGCCAEQKIPLIPSQSHGFLREISCEPLSRHRPQEEEPAFAVRGGVDEALAV